jgi:hypothetical protein
MNKQFGFVTGIVTIRLVYGPMNFLTCCTTISCAFASATLAGISRLVADETLFHLLNESTRVYSKVSHYGPTLVPL